MNANGKPRKRSPWLHRFQFTAETARANAIKAVESRRAKLMAMTHQAVTAHDQALRPQNASGDDPARANGYDQHIARLRLRLDHTTDPREIAALAQAIWRLEEVRCIFAGIPKPGQRRPGRDDNRRRPAVFSSPVLEIGPAQPANTTTGSVPEQPQDTPENALVQVVK
jgi:hypothetical protein